VCGDWLSIASKEHHATTVRCQAVEEALHAFKIREPIQSITLHHIPEDLNPEQLCCENINIVQQLKNYAFMLLQH